MVRFQKEKMGMSFIKITPLSISADMTYHALYIGIHT
jgi:hypothetical protein